MKSQSPKDDGSQEHGDFSPEVHLSTVKLLPVVSTVTSMVLGLGHANAGPSGTPRHHSQAWCCNDTSNVLGYPLRLPQGGCNLSQSTGGGQEQSPFLANASTNPPSRLGAVLSKSNKISTGHNDLQVPLDANYASNALRSLNLTLKSQFKQGRKSWEVLLSSKGVTQMKEGQERPHTPANLLFISPTK